jgi:homoserine kinase type II
MAVYTEVSFADASALLRRLDAGELTGLQGIRGGIENTNYYAESARGRYVITLFERLGPAQLPFYLQLMRHLARKGLPVPDPLGDARGELLHSLSGKPAVVVTRLPGETQLAPSAEHCERVGSALARMHRAGEDFALTQPNLRGLSWWAQTVPQLAAHVTPEQHNLLSSELSFQQRLASTEAYATLPRGPIHADLFRDNVLFQGAQLSGLLDFYFAAVDTFTFDIAVCLNDWCTDRSSGCLLESHRDGFLSGYARERELSVEERALLPAMLRAAALRFWISRLFDRHRPRAAALLEPRDPAEFERVLRSRIESSASGGCGVVCSG